MADGVPSARLRAVPGSVRARTTAGAVLVVGAVLVAASIALVMLMESAMHRSVTEAARLRARDLASSLEQGRPASSLVVGNDDDVVIQVVTSSGRVMASTSSLSGDPPIARFRRGSRTAGHLPVGDDDPFAVVAKSAHTGGRPVTVLVGRNLDLVRETATTISHALFVGIPVLLLILGLTTWAVVGRSLAPVELMRREVADISETELHRRVPTLSGDDEIARLAQTMNGMLARLEEALTRQQRLVSDASHELRNPIAAIRQHAEVALAHPDDITSRELAADVLAEDLRLQHLAEDLLLLARADEHGLELRTRPLDLDDLVLEETRRLKQATDLSIDSGGVSAARLQGDVVKLRRVVRNLTDNAARHASSAIRLAVRQSGGNVVLEVEDDGAGIPTESRAAVFERFTRLDGARDRGRGGAGLGLAIVLEIVAAHGGNTSVDEGRLGGARFVVVMPRTRS